MRWILRMAVVGLILVAVVVGGVLLYFNQIARSLVESEATGAMGVQTTLSSFRLRPLAGRISLGGLHVDNPEGFSDPSFLALTHGTARVKLETLTTDLIEISLMELEGLDVFIERAGGATNYGKVLDSLTRVGDEAPDEASSGPSVVIRDLYIRDIRAHAKLSALGVPTPGVSVDIPEIHLTNVGAEDGGVELRELAATLTGAVLTAVVRSGAALPAGLTNGLTGQLSRLNEKVPVTGVISDLGSAGGSVVKGAAARAKDAVRGLGKLLGGDDD